MSDLVLQGRIARNATDDLQIHAGVYWKTEVVDIRWYSNDKPTRKGVRMNVEEAVKLHTILTRLLGEVDVDVEID